MAGYKGQAKAEGGLRFLTDPLLFVSSLCVKKPGRLQGLLMVMTLALLVYSVAQRRLRHALAEQNATIPNQINQPTSRPTLRWVLQRLEGMERVRLLVDGTVREVRTGLHALHVKWGGLSRSSLQASSMRRMLLRIDPEMLLIF